jgi:predicted transcriptional regulator
MENNENSELVEQSVLPRRKQGRSALLTPKGKKMHRVLKKERILKATGGMSTNPDILKVFALNEAGLNNTQIAEKLNFSADQVHRITKSPAFNLEKSKLARLIERDAVNAIRNSRNQVYSAIAKMQERAVEASDFLIKVLRSETEGTKDKLVAAFKILEIAGVEQYKESVVFTREYSKEEVESANRVIKESVEITNKLRSNGNSFILSDDERYGTTTIDVKREDTVISPSEDR